VLAVPSSLSTAVVVEIAIGRLAMMAITGMFRMI